MKTLVPTSNSLGSTVKPDAFRTIGLFLWVVLFTFPSMVFGQSLQTLYSFHGPDGAQPTAGLIQASDGNFYGTTSYGGTDGLGTVYRITTNGLLTTLVSFRDTNGARPNARLLQTVDGNFYGTTTYGGTNNLGTVFRMTPAGALTTLVNFGGTNGARPFAELIQTSDGRLYGATFGAANETATVFRMTTNGAFTVLAQFQGSYAGSGSPLVQGTDGHFYGTTSVGGSTSDGSVFKLTTNGMLSTLYSFDYSATFLPANPEAGLVQGSDGNFYGTTAFGGTTASPRGFGTYDAGTVFKITPAGSITFLASFQNTNGAIPLAELVEGSDGNFYGTTQIGGPSYNLDYGFGTIFKITPAGALTPLFSFAGTNGSFPEAKLLLAGDGNLYGTTTSGGTDDMGTIFRLVLPGPPSLSIARSNTSVIISWPVTSLNFQLQQTTNVALTNSWSLVGPPDATNGNQIRITLPTTASRKFFRLRSQ